MRLGPVDVRRPQFVEYADDDDARAYDEVSLYGDQLSSTPSNHSGDADSSKDGRAARSCSRSENGGTASPLMWNVHYSQQDRHSTSWHSVSFFQNGAYNRDLGASQHRRLCSRQIPAAAPCAHVLPLSQSKTPY